MKAQWHTLKRDTEGDGGRQDSAREREKREEIGGSANPISNDNLLKTAASMEERIICQS